MANGSIDIRHFDVFSIAAPVRNPPTLTVANRISCSLAMVQLEQKLMPAMEKYNVAMIEAQDGIGQWRLVHGSWRLQSAIHNLQSAIEPGA
jgi:hypothetical protein